MNPSEPGSVPIVRLRDRVRIGFSWNLVGAVFNQGSTFTFNILAANILGLHVFGEFAIILSTISTVSLVAQLGMGYTAAKHVAEFRLIDKDKTGRILGLCSVVSTGMALVASLALLISAPWLSASVWKIPLLTSELMTASIAVFFSARNLFMAGALSGLESFRPLGLAGMVSGSLYLVICSGGVWLWGLQGAVTGMAASAMIQWAILRTFLRTERLSQGIKIHYRGLWRERTVLLGFALPGALSGFVTTPALWLASTILIRQDGGCSQVAIYAAATNLRVMVLFLPNIFNNVCMSLLNNQKGLNDQVGYRRLFWANVAITGSAVLIGAVLVILAGPQLLEIFGKDFSEGYGVLCILMLSTVPEGIANAFYQIIQSTGKMWSQLFVMSLPRDTMLVILAWVMVPVYSADGLALAYLASSIFAFAAVLLMSHGGPTSWGWGRFVSQ